jgi:hypothetical protein
VVKEALSARIEDFSRKRRVRRPVLEKNILSNKAYDPFEQFDCFVKGGEGKLMSTQGTATKRMED